MREIILGTIAFIIAGSLAYGGWLIKREFNYSFDYEDKVTKTVHAEMDETIAALKARILILENKGK